MPENASLPGGGGSQVRESRVGADVGRPRPEMSATGGAWNSGESLEMMWKNI